MKRRVAIVLAAKSILHKAAGVAFNKIIKSKDHSEYYESDIFFTSFDDELMRSQLEKIIEQKYDAIFGCGFVFSRVMKQVYDERGHTKDLPLGVFAGVKWPVEQNIINSVRRPGGRMAGVLREGYSSIIQAHFIASLPQVPKRIAILFTPECEGGFLYEQGHMTRAYFEKIGETHVDMYPVCLDQDIYATMRVLLRKNPPNMVLTFEGCTTGEVPGQICDIAAERGVPLFGEGQDAVAAGALYAYGGNHEVLGRKAFYLMHRMLKKNLDPATTPVTFVPNNRSFFVNDRAIRKGLVSQEWIARMEKELETPIIVMKDEDTLNGYD